MATATATRPAVTIAYTEIVPNVWAVSPQTPNLAPYKVSYDPSTGEWDCTCPSCQRGHRRCKHITAIAASLAPAPARIFYCIECGQVEALPGKLVCARCNYRDLEVARLVAATLPTGDDIPVTQTAIYRETLAAMPEILAAERNAMAKAAHTFEPGSTRLASTLPDLWA